MIMSAKSRSKPLLISKIEITRKEETNGLCSTPLVYIKPIEDIEESRIVGIHPGWIALIAVVIIALVSALGGYMFLNHKKSDYESV